MADATLVSFIRKRDYNLVKELGQGACGKTVLLLDDYINELFVCKKYVPYSEEHRQSLFTNFVREVSLLHRVFHPNVVRVFNYYLYPDNFSGYILMEYVDGADIEVSLTSAPEKINELFLQTIDGFRYLEANNILHRDIRPQNILVRHDGILKIIDLGFGKRVQEPEDFDKSISLNLWCESPMEFKSSTYDFRTEVYFVGKLFEKIIKEVGIDSFNFIDLLNRMCQRDPAKRIASFFDVDKEVQSNKFLGIDFSEQEMSAYRLFSKLLSQHTTKILDGSKYKNDITKIQKELEDQYRGFMLEETVPDASNVISCFLGGTYYLKRSGFPVQAVKEFILLLKASTPEKRRIILANIHTRLDAVPRYTEAPPTEDDDIPF